MSFEEQLEDWVQKNSGVLDAKMFDAYRLCDQLPGNAIRQETFRFLTQITRLVDENPEQLITLLETLQQHLSRENTQSRLYDGVSSARDDRDQSWENELENLFKQSTGVGALHLELGVWSAWPQERTQALKDLYRLSEVIRLDINPAYDLDVVGDAQRLPFRDESLDQIQADSVLEHLPNPHQVIHECFRVLKPGGFVHITTPFVLNVHGYPDDYLRYTPSFYEHVFSQAGFRSFRVDTDAARGLYCTMHNCSKTAIVSPEAANASVLQALHLAVMTLLGTLVPLDNAFENKSAHWFHAVRCFAVKPGAYHPSQRTNNLNQPFLERCKDLFICPYTHEEFDYVGSHLISIESKIRYGIQDGIPIFTKPKVVQRNAARRRFFPKRSIKL